MLGVVEVMDHRLHQVVVVGSICHPVNEDNNLIHKVVTMAAMEVFGDVVETVTSKILSLFFHEFGLVCDYMR